MIYLQPLLLSYHQPLETLGTMIDLRPKHPAPAKPPSLRMETDAEEDLEAIRDAKRKMLHRMVAKAEIAAALDPAAPGSLRAMRMLDNLDKLRAELSNLEND